MVEKDICPICGKLALEKIETEPEMEWLMPPNCEGWGCLECGNAFFKKIQNKG